MESPWSGRARIVVVEDDPQIVHMFSSSLVEQGYDVLTCPDAREVVRFAAADPPDLILLDVETRGLPWYETTRSLKEEPATADVPIILVTGLYNAADRVKGLEAGADEFLLRPVDRSELLVRVKTAVELHRQHRELDGAGDLGDAVTAGEPRRVLVVLDDNAEQGLICSCLMEKGYDVLEIANGLTPVVRDADLVIVDAKNSAMLRARFPVLALISPSDTRLRVRLLESGVTELLVRPFDTKEVALRVRRILKQMADLSRLEERCTRALKAASCDSLTRLSNHASFRRSLLLEIRRAERHSHPTSLIMIDIDDFKAKNDTFGHPVGDRVLVEVAGRIRLAVRDIDFVARYGGEEFAVILPCTDKPGALLLAERIRAAIADLRVADHGSRRRVEVTASIGVAVCPDDAPNPEGLIQSADRLLYDAKESGKNRVLAKP